MENEILDRDFLENNYSATIFHASTNFSSEKLAFAGACRRQNFKHFAKCIVLIFFKKLGGGLSVRKNLFHF